VIVEKGCQQLHSFMCGTVADATRGDAIMLLQPTGQGQV
jgi:hypothetical protein